MRCKMCLQERRLVDAHIIPRSFYKPMISGAEPPNIISSASQFRRKKVRIGVYDKTIVCAECEDRFNDWDNYAPRLLLSKATPMSEFKDEQGTPLALAIEEVDYEKLKLFFISLLWRISASSHLFFSQVRLGPHEEILRNMILRADPGDEEMYSVLLAKWDNDLAAHVLLYPHMQRYDGISYVRCYLNSYIAEIKVDKRRTPEFSRGLILKPNKPLHIVLRELKSSHEYEVLRTIVKAQAKQ